MAELEELDKVLLEEKEKLCAAVVFCNHLSHLLETVCSAELAHSTTLPFVTEEEKSSLVVSTQLCALADDENIEGASQTRLSRSTSLSSAEALIASRMTALETILAVEKGAAARALEALSKRDSDVSMLEAENKSLESHRQRIQQENSELSQSLQSCEAELRRSGALVGHLQQQVEVMTEQQQVDAQKIVELNSSLALMTSSSDEQQVKLKQMDECSDQLRGQVSDLEQRSAAIVAKLESDLLIAMTSNGQLDEQLQQARRDSESVEQTLVAVRDRVVALERELEQLRQDFEQSEALCIELQSSIATLKSQLNDAESSIRQLQESEASNAERIVELQGQLQESKLLAEQLEGKLVQTEREGSSQAQMLSTQLADAQNENQSLSRTMQQSQSSLLSLLEKVGHITDDLLRILHSPQSVEAQPNDQIDAITVSTECFTYIHKIFLDAEILC